MATRHGATAAKSTAQQQAVTHQAVTQRHQMAIFVWVSLTIGAMAVVSANDSLERQASWQAYSVGEMSQMLRSSLDELGIVPATMDQASEQFSSAIENRDADPLDALIASIRPIIKSLDDLVESTQKSLSEAGASIDPSSEAYGDIESLPKSMRMSVRTWLGRELIRARLYDEALPVIAEVDANESIDPAAVLFYRGACYHALLMKKEALADLRRLLENEQDTPVRFTRTAQLMVADIKPLKEDSLDEISRIMTDVTRRLDLGRSGDDVQDRAQEVIDKLSKLIEQIEEQQQQQQQQQQQAGGGSQSQGQQQGSPMNDSQIAGASGSGDVDPKKFKDRDGWGNLPPAERQQALQQIGRDLPTHYREAIEAYFRKLATENQP